MTKALLRAVQEMFGVTIETCAAGCFLPENGVRPQALSPNPKPYAPASSGADTRHLSDTEPRWASWRGSSSVRPAP